MKRLLLLLALSLPILAKAQTTALPLPTDGSGWLIHNLFSAPGPQDAFKLTEFVAELNGDSIWGTSAYQIPNCDEPSAPPSSGFGFYENNNKWYRSGNLFFDWDLNVGDSIFLDDWGDTFFVSAIDTVQYADFIPRRVYHIVDADGTPVFWYGMELTYIEGIGSSLWGLEVWGPEMKPLFQCFFDKNGLLIFHNDWSLNFPELSNSCCPIISVEEAATLSFKLFPSPASDQTALQFEAAHIPQSIQIFNATGQLMHTEKVLGRLQMQVNVSDFAKGVYTVRGRFENGEEVSEKLVVE
jgi:hypothetical protein